VIWTKHYRSCIEGCIEGDPSRLWMTETIVTYGNPKRAAEEGGGYSKLVRKMWARGHGAIGRRTTVELFF